jgi:outer membrane biosynthesis protein TonB
MYFDLEDYHPEEPRVMRAISAREGVLLSLIAHLIALVLIILAPRLGWWKPHVVPVDPTPDQAIRFVSIQPAIDRSALPVHTPDPSDLDRRSATITHVPKPTNAAPNSMGNTSERTVATPPDSPPPGDPQPQTPPPNTPVVPDLIQPSHQTGSNGLANSLHNLSKYLQNTQFNNPQGGQTDTDAAIQFDSKGIDFGPWLARFKAQVMSNWMVPQAAMVQHGHVVFQFYVGRDGTISDIHIVQPAKVDVFNTAAQSALFRSNPTVPLPKDYPAVPGDKILFTVTFFYNEEIPH